MQPEYKSSGVQIALLFFAALSASFSVFVHDPKPGVRLFLFLLVFLTLGLSMLKELDRARKAIADSDARAKEADESRRETEALTDRLLAEIGRTATRIHSMSLNMVFDVPFDELKDVALTPFASGPDYNEASLVEFYEEGRQADYHRGDKIVPLGDGPTPLRIDVLAQGTGFEKGSPMQTLGYFWVNLSEVEYGRIHADKRRKVLQLYFGGLVAYELQFSRDFNCANDLDGKILALNPSRSNFEEFAGAITIHTDSGIDYNTGFEHWPNRGYALSNPLTRDETFGIRRPSSDECSSI